MNKTRVIIDCDTGSDDAIALLLACASPELEVLGVTVTWGNNPVDECVRHTLQVLELAGRPDIPVYRGCGTALVRYLDEPFVSTCSGVVDGRFVSIHPADLGLPEPSAAVQPQPAGAYLAETLMRQEEPVTLIGIGPASNLGLALRLEPRIVDHLSQIILMGGGVGMGNATPLAEANFNHDPEAAKIVLNCGAPCRIVPLNATLSAPFTLAEARQWEHSRSPRLRFAGRMLATRIRAEGLLGIGDGRQDAIHDALAAAWLIDPAVISESAAMDCDVDLSPGEAYGRLLAQKDGGSRIRVALKADKTAYQTLLIQRLGG